jgi:hypothetical protein
LGTRKRTQKNRAIRSNLFACGKKDFRSYPLRKRQLESQLPELPYQFRGLVLSYRWQEPCF